METQKPKTRNEKQTHTVVDTIKVTPAIVKSWLIGPHQRPLRVNDKVRALAEEIKNDGGVWPGMVTLGQIGAKTYVLDGQHRREAFLLSGQAEGYTDVRVHFFDNLEDMGPEFVRLNSCLVRMGPDDILRALEGTYPNLHDLRELCPFIGYDNMRRNPSSAMISMSQALRWWESSRQECPSTPTYSAQQLAEKLSEEDVGNLANFLNLANDAFGRDPGYYRLWGSLNMTLCAWLYRNTVMTQYSPRVPKLTDELFRSCLMSLSANSLYLDWLVGRKIGDRDRSAAYHRIKQTFADRLREELHRKVALPSPAWYLQ